MRDNVNILEKYTENLIVKKNLLQTTVDAYKLDINEYLEFLKKRDIDILDTDEKIFNEYFSDAEKKYISDSIKSEIIDSKSHEFNMQTDIKISEDILNKGIEETNQENIEIEVLEHESSSLDDNMYYELDSDSLINVFDDLENYQKNETEDDE